MRPIVSFLLMFGVAALLPKSWGMDEWQHRMLDKENGHRADHQVAPLEYNEELGAGAQEYADHLVHECLSLDKLSHSSDETRTFNGKSGALGENIYRATYLSHLDHAPHAADNWYNEIRHYPWGENYQGRDRPIHVKHFTQQVWAGTQQVGYGVGLKDGCGSMYVVARYYPRGNVYEHFNENVLPKL